MSTLRGPVIVVDDDAAVRKSLKFALELEGLDVRLYGSGGELLAEADLPASGCLVVDFHMPGLDGIALLKRLRGSRVALPAILITGKATEDMRGRADRAGYREVLEKPLEDNALLESIRCALAVPALA
jgi:FixJ family two-component response regulator